MSLPEIATREEWLAARRALLEREKALTSMQDALNADRRRMPMVRVEKAYVFAGPDGEVSLLDIFEGKRQLIVQHFMFDPEWENGCSSCTASVDEISDGVITHLQARETTFALVSRAPYPKLAAYRQARGWTIPWYSSNGSDFNYDFHVTLDESVTPLELNFRTRAEVEAAPSVQWALQSDQPLELPGISCFLRDGDEVFHTNSTYARGTEDLAGAYTWLDLTALGRQEEWEEPKGRAAVAHGTAPDFS
ncbi:MAG TPA: DUF899 domain-containing protein [Gaiellales bacterium]|jgi:predicted dithiol-disulfide oxidoreductase (DUF899 family)|nr:DUF899 domain-containing protein [Gaiellales bacterium]